MQRSLIIFIVGTTAVGKTKLSIQLCKAIGGQVINCDSKQLYKYANIMTAKATKQQIQGIPHHMLDVLDLHQNCYNRNKYFSQAMKCVQDIKARGKVPVIVGGTNYYLQTLLYDLDMLDPTLQNNKQNQNDNEHQNSNQQADNKITQKQAATISTNSVTRITKQQIQKMSRQQRYAQLQKVDPTMATKLHKNDQTRITNFLTRYAQTGIPPSSNYKPLLHKLRFDESVLFWIRNSNKKQLHQLMQTRIDKMVDNQGLIQIMTIFKYMDMRGVLNQDKMGVLQSIGYKQYLDAYKQIKQILSSEQFDKTQKTYQQIEAFVISNIKQIKQKLSGIQKRSSRSTKITTLLNYCKQILVKNTIDYSKRQVTWLRNRIFACQQNRSNFFVLQLANKFQNKSINVANSNLMNRFENNVQNRALDILKKINKDGIGLIKEDIKEFNATKHQSITEWKKYYCQQCEIQVNGSRQWDEHLKSRKHRNSSTKKDRKYQIIKERIRQKSQQKQAKNKPINKQQPNNQKIQQETFKHKKQVQDNFLQSQQQNNTVNKKVNK